MGQIETAELRKKAADLRKKAAELRRQAFQTDNADYQLKLLNLAQLFEIRAQLRDENAALGAILAAPVDVAPREVSGRRDASNQAGSV